MSRNTRTRILLTAVAALLLVVMAVGGTIAYLQAKSDTVTNTFAPTGIKIELDEANLKADGTLDEADRVKKIETYQLVPGKNLNKSPKVTVVTPDTMVDIFVFLDVDDDWTLVTTDTTKMTYKHSTYEDLTFKVDAEKWNYLEDGVYYTTWTVGAPAEFNVIDDKLVYVASGLTESEMAQMTTKPTLSFQAYAIQQLGFEDKPAEAWKEIQTRTDGGTGLFTAQ